MDKRFFLNELQTIYLHMVQTKRSVYIRYRQIYFYLYCIWKMYLHIIYTTCLYLIWKKMFCLNDIQTNCLYVVQTKKCLYQVQKNIFFLYCISTIYLYIIQTKNLSTLSIDKNPYAIQTKILFSIPDIDIFSTCHVGESIFVYIAQRQVVYIRYRQNIIVYIPYRQYIVHINQKQYSYIFMQYLNSIQNSIFTLINSVYIKIKQ